MFDISKYSKGEELQIISSFANKNSLLNEINAFGYIKHIKQFEEKNDEKIMKICKYGNQKRLQIGQFMEVRNNWICSC